MVGEGERYIDSIGLSYVDGYRYALEVGARIECVVEPAEDEWGCHC